MKLTLSETLWLVTSLNLTPAGAVAEEDREEFEQRMNLSGKSKELGSCVFNKIAQSKYKALLFS